MKDLRVVQESSLKTIIIVVSFGEVKFWPRNYTLLLKIKHKSKTLLRYDKATSDQ